MPTTTTACATWTTAPARCTSATQRARSRCGAPRARGFTSFCRGAPGNYPPAASDYARVDAIEIATGPAGLKEDPQPGPNPFTPLAIRFWEEAIVANGPNSNKIAAVGSSDSHRAGCQ